MNDVLVEIEVEINPTEDPEKIRTSVDNIFWNVDFERQTKRGKNLLCVKATGIDSLTKIYNLLRRERILDAARGVLFGGLGEKSLTFYFNKQVAYVGHLSFSEPEAESPLGPIRVQIRCDNPRELIDWLAPKKL